MPDVRNALRESKNNLLKMIADGIMNPTKQISGLSFTDTENSDSDISRPNQNSLRQNDSIDEYYMTTRKKSTANNI